MPRRKRAPTDWAAINQEISEGKLPRVKKDPITEAQDELNELKLKRAQKRVELDKKAIVDMLGKQEEAQKLMDNIAEGKEIIDVRHGGLYRHECNCDLSADVKKLRGDVDKLKAKDIVGGGAADFSMSVVESLNKKVDLLEKGMSEAVKLVDRLKDLVEKRDSGAVDAAKLILDAKIKGVTERQPGVTWAKQLTDRLDKLSELENQIKLLWRAVDTQGNTIETIGREFYKVLVNLHLMSDLFAHTTAPPPQEQKK